VKIADVTVSGDDFNQQVSLGMTVTFFGRSDKYNEFDHTILG
jgi:hypothetical protein